MDKAQSYSGAALMWIRSPAYDGCWFLSGFPLAVGLTLISAWGGFNMRHWVAWLIAVQVLDLAHRLAPMLLVWRHRGFTRVARAASVRFAVLPALLLSFGVAAGFVSLTWWPNTLMFAQGQSIVPSTLLTINPLVWLSLIFWLGNFWHYGRQNFGIMSIYRRRSGVVYPDNQRRVDLWMMMGIQAAFFIQVLFALPATVWIIHYYPTAQTNIMIYIAFGVAGLAVMFREAAISGRWYSPRLIFGSGQAIILLLGPGLWLLVINSVNHWLTEIGLCTHVEQKNRGSYASLIALSACAVAIYFVPLEFFTYPPVLGFSAALGLVHFWYDAHLWKLSDPQVRATIGRDLFTAVSLPPDVFSTAGNSSLARSTVR